MCKFRTIFDNENFSLRGDEIQHHKTVIQKRTKTHQECYQVDDKLVLGCPATSATSE